MNALFRVLRIAALTARRRGVSEIVATVLTVAITIITGTAVFGYVNGQAGSSAQAYGNAVGNSVQYLGEKFTVVDMSWTSTTSVTLWLYNTGNIQLSLLQVRFYDSAGLVNLLFNYSLIGGANTNRVHDLRSSNSLKCGISGSSYESPTIVGSGAFAAATSTTATIQITIPPSGASPSGQTCPSFGQNIASGTTYYVAVSGIYGNSNIYGQTR